MAEFAVGIAGHGRSGKDTVAELLSDLTGLLYVAGTSWYAREFVHAALGRAGIEYPSPLAAWRDRHNHRVFWAHAIGEYNRDDPVRLYRDCLADQSILTGVRRRHEKQALDAEGLVDLWLWIERPGVPADPTMEFGPGECDVTILNDGDMAGLRAKLKRITDFCGKLRNR